MKQFCFRSFWALVSAEKHIILIKIYDNTKDFRFRRNSYLEKEIHFVLNAQFWMIKLSVFAKKEITEKKRRKRK